MFTLVISISSNLASYSVLLEWYLQGIESCGPSNGLSEQLINFSSALPDPAPFVCLLFLWLLLLILFIMSYSSTQSSNVSSSTLGTRQFFQLTLYAHPHSWFQLPPARWWLINYISHPDLSSECYIHRFNLKTPLWCTKGT